MIPSDRDQLVADITKLLLDMFQHEMDARTLQQGQLHLSSLQIVDLVVSIEDLYQFEFPDELLDEDMFANATTLGDALWRRLQR